jgi:hypothetical protein
VTLLKEKDLKMQCNDKAGRTWSRLAMALLVGDEMLGCAPQPYYAAGAGLAAHQYRRTDGSSVRLHPSRKKEAEVRSGKLDDWRSGICPVHAEEHEGMKKVRFEGECFELFEGGGRGPGWFPTDHVQAYHGEACIKEATGDQRNEAKVTASLNGAALEMVEEMWRVSRAGMVIANVNNSVTSCGQQRALRASHIV